MIIFFVFLYLPGDCPFDHLLTIEVNNNRRQLFFQVVRGSFKSCYDQDVSEFPGMIVTNIV